MQLGCGSVSVDFLAAVASYPKPDDKTRSTSFQVLFSSILGYLGYILTFVNFSQPKFTFSFSLLNTYQCKLEGKSQLSCSSFQWCPQKLSTFA